MTKITETSPLPLLKDKQRKFLDETVMKGVPPSFCSDMLDEMFFGYIDNENNEDPVWNKNVALAYRITKRALSYIDSKVEIQNGEVVLMMTIQF